MRPFFAELRLFEFIQNFDINLLCDNFVDECI